MMRSLRVARMLASCTLMLSPLISPILSRCEVVLDLKDCVASVPVVHAQHLRRCILKLKLTG